MTDEREDSKHNIDEPESSLPPPLFDERATAKARPVQPISGARVSAWYKGVISLHRAVTSGFRALVLVVIAGLVTGALVGMVWVKAERQVTDLSVPANDSVFDSAPDARDETPRVEVFGVSGLQSSSQRIIRNRKSRSRPKQNRATRAYLVDVIR